MEAKELRIGNIVNFGLVSEPIKITKVNPDSVNILMAEPIPLTEEWLLRFGFETNEWDSNASFRMMIGNNDYTIVFYRNNISFCEIGDIFAKDIYYVHQLQNLYFALTGKELTLIDL